MDSLEVCGLSNHHKHRHPVTATSCTYYILVPSIDIKIVNPDTLVACAEREIGEVWVNSGCKAMGYWGQSDSVSQVFNVKIAGGNVGYLRTGMATRKFKNRPMVLICFR